MKKWIPRILLVLSSACYTLGGALLSWPIFFGLMYLMPTLMDHDNSWLPTVVYIFVSLLGFGLSIRWRNSRLCHAIVGFLSCSHVLFFFIYTIYYWRKNSASSQNWGAGGFEGIGVLLNLFVMLWAILLALGPAFGLLRLWLLSKWGIDQEFSTEETS